MLSFAYPIKEKASNRQWSSGGNKVLFSFQQMFDQQIIRNFLSTSTCKSYKKAQGDSASNIHFSSSY